MTGTYAPLVKAIRAQMATQIQARGTADGVLAASTVFAGDKVQDRAYQQKAVYVLKEVGMPPEEEISRLRSVRLRFPVVCMLQALIDSSATDALTDIEGVVVDAIGADPSLAGKCVWALPQEIEPGALLDKDHNVTLYTSTVWVEVLIKHQLG